jgi:subtilisin family serine protease
MKELFISFIVGIATFGSLTYLARPNQTASRQQNETEPTAINIAQPSDPKIQLNWGLTEIEAVKAWQKEKGSKRIVVAIIDTGCDVHHPDLRQNIWRNPGEGGLDENGLSKATNGIDDDGDGLVDDVYGWNFAGADNDVTDDVGHGTHIAGIIGGLSSGVSPDVSLMILKYYDPNQSGALNLTNTIKAIRYAVEHGANIINYSGGGLMRSPEEEEAIRWAAEQGVLVVAAAGNEGANSDFLHFYPADYNLPNILSVTGIDRNGRLMNTSNYGASTVGVAAPGKNIYSTLPNGQYGYMSGTSQATAFATGVAALLMAHDARMMQPEVVIRQLANHGRPSPALKDKVRSGSLLNAAIALENVDLPIAQATPKRQPAEKN